MPRKRDVPMDKKSEHMQDDQQSVSCEVCRREVPRSAARSTEDKDYVRHFCGDECFQRWQGEAKRQTH